MLNPCHTFFSFLVRTFEPNGSLWNRDLAVSHYDPNSGGGAGGRGKKRPRNRGGASASSGARGGAAAAVGRGGQGGARGGAAAVPLLSMQQLRDALNAVPPTPPRGSAQ